MSKVRVVKIDPDRWACGGKRAIEGNSLYRKDDKRMCCLGFAARQLFRARITQIKGKAMPSSAGLGNSFEEIGLGRQALNTMTDINDVGGNGTKAQRIKKLNAKLEEWEVPVRFELMPKK